MGDPPSPRRPLHRFEVAPHRFPPPGTQRHDDLRERWCLAVTASLPVGGPLLGKQLQAWRSEASWFTAFTDSDRNPRVPSTARFVRYAIAARDSLTAYGRLKEETSDRAVAAHGDGNRHAKLAASSVLPLP